MKTKKELYKIRLDYFKWLVSKGIKTTFESVCKFQKRKVKSKPGELDLSHLKVKNYIVNEWTDIKEYQKASWQAAKEQNGKNWVKIKSFFSNLTGQSNVSQD